MVKDLKINFEALTLREHHQGYGKQEDNWYVLSRSSCEGNDVVEDLTVHFAVLKLTENKTKALQNKKTQ